MKQFRIKHIIKWLYNNLEWCFWTLGLLVLIMYNPESENHFSICPLHQLGLNFCPGCGLGRSISFLFHGEIQPSIQAHPLGIPALLIISFRWLRLTKNLLKQSHTYGKIN